MKLVLFDDHALFAMSLRVLLQDHVSSFHHFTSTEDMERILRDLQPDIVCMDIHLGETNGLEAGETLLSLFPHINLVFLSGYDLIDYHNRAIQIGARAFINKNIEPKQFQHILDSVAQGKVFFPNHNLDHVEMLSEREKEVLQCLSDGLSQQETAENLSISRRTVGNHIQSILMKLDVNSTVSAIVKGIELGMIQLKSNR